METMPESRSELSRILESKLGAKAKVKAIAEGLLTEAIDPARLGRSLVDLSSSDRATTVEALESATRTMSSLVDGRLFERLVGCLSDPSPRVRWEASRTIANVASDHPSRLEAAVAPLLANTNHDGKVVRWATAQAMAALLRAGCEQPDLIKAVTRLAKSESDEGARKAYAKALREHERD